MTPKLIDATEIAAREQVILDAALEYIRTEGIGSLTVDKVVARVPYSKGTVYNHFISREDMLTGLCNHCVSTLYELFMEAVNFEGNSREKLLSLCIAYMLHAQAEPTRFMLLVTAKTPSMHEKASQARLDEHERLDTQLMTLFCGQIQAGIEAGELQLAEPMTVQRVAFSLWSMSFGTIALLQSHLERCTVRSMMELERELLTHLNLVMDGLNWQPRSCEQDWQAVAQACKSRVMPLIGELKLKEDTSTENEQSD